MWIQDVLIFKNDTVESLLYVCDNVDAVRSLLFFL